jgi:hypothetical protein
MDAEPTTREVRLLGVPAALYLESLSHLDDLLRELRFVMDAIESGRVSRISIEMAHGIEELLDGFDVVQGATAAHASAAVERGDPTLDLVFELPLDEVPVSDKLLGLLDQADGWANRGVLLTGSSTTEMVRLRRWIAEEIAMQLGGAAPSPYGARA